MENFTPISAGIGGILIGLAASMLLLTHGRIAGISNILSGFFEPNASDKTWRILFFAGLIIGSSIYVILEERFLEINLNPFQLNDQNHIVFLVVGGLLVGFGSQVGSGCTSGHGVCGLGRLSFRSLVATITFMITACLTVLVVRYLIGG